MKILVALFILFGTSSIAHATTGTNLLPECKKAIISYDGGNLSDPEMLSGAHCMGMVEGVMKTLDFWHGVASANPRQDKRDLVCIPASVIVSQSVRVVVKFLEDNPDQLNKDAATLIAFALKGSFACQP